jgi:hypothetical protein
MVGAVPSDRSVGSSRRFRDAIAVRHRLVAILYSHAGDRPPGPQQRLLHHVVGVVYRTQHPIAVLVQLAPVRLDKLGERPLVALARGSQQHQQGIGLGCALGCGLSRPHRDRGWLGTR